MPETNIAETPIGELDDGGQYLRRSELAADMGQLLTAAVDGDITADPTDLVYPEFAAQTEPALDDDFEEITSEDDEIEDDEEQLEDKGENGGAAVPERKGKYRDEVVAELLAKYKKHPTVIASLESLKQYEIQENGSISQRYDQETRQYKLLTAQDERILFKRLQDGFDSYELGPDQTDERKLIDAVIAHQTIYLSNLRLVYKYAIRKVIPGKSELEDLMQEGNIGLSKAINRFDYKRGVKFSTYAVNWIRQIIQRSVSDTGDTIRIPIHMREKIYVIYRTFSYLSLELGRDPTIDELCTETRLPKRLIVDVIQNELYRDTVSLDAPVGREEDNSCIGDFVQNGDSLETDDLVDDLQIAEAIAAIFDSSLIRTVDKYVISMRYGIVADELRGTQIEVKGEKIEYDALIDAIGNGGTTLEFVGGLLGVTRERVRQIQERALKRLRESGALRRIALDPKE